MAPIKCKMCGGDLVISEGMTVAECEYCGTKQTVPTADNEKKLTLFARANRLRLANEFDKAAGVYESIVADFPEEAEAYWGLVLCRYGIEYVDDPATGRKIPTCHRSSFESVMEDADFDQACENADAIARRQYREEAKQIEEIRKGIIEVSGKEAPYDIFICYKETDENGERTLDSVIAQDVYDALTEKGYRVFFSRISLEDKLGTEYEPYIFAALNSANVMLAFGTDYEYYNAVWVKNEWSRFLKLMASDKSKHLIPCYKGLDAYDMPKEFAKLQAQDMGKVGAMQDLLRGIDKLLPRKQENTSVESAQPPVQQVVQSGGPNVDAILKRGQQALEDENWEKAEEAFNKALDMDAECGQAFLGLVLAERKFKNRDEFQLKCDGEDFSYDQNYSRALKYADNEMLPWFTRMESFHNLADIDLLSMANSGSARAQFLLGLKYQEGDGLPQDYEKAYEWYNRAAEQGYISAQLNLGKLFETGIGVTQNYSKALLLYQQAADHAFPEGEYALARLYYSYYKNYNNALDYYVRAAKHGVLFAYYYLGQMYELGLAETSSSGIGIKDYHRAAEYYELGARRGDLKAQYALGVMYEAGNGIPQDYLLAKEWYHKAACQEFTQAQRSLALLYEEGKGVRQDYGKAYEWFSKAADNGDTFSVYQLGVLYQNGYGIKQDYRKAHDLFLRATKSGLLVAYYNLGYLYEYGYGVGVDKEKALACYEKATESCDYALAQKASVRIRDIVFADVSSETERNIISGIVTKETKNIKEEIENKTKSNLTVDSINGYAFLLHLYPWGRGLPHSINGEFSVTVEEKERLFCGYEVYATFRVNNVRYSKVIELLRRSLKDYCIALGEPVIVEYTGREVDKEYAPCERIKMNEVQRLSYAIPYTYSARDNSNLN